MPNRREFLIGAAVAAALGLPPAEARVLRSFSTPSGPVTFKYFISTTGSDSNNGLTPATAWAITSFSDTSSNRSLMAGQNVGIVAGTYSADSVSTTHSSDYTYSYLNIPAGTSGSPTYIASCNSSGVYTRGAATITFTGGAGTQVLGMMGAGGGTVAGSASYITVDGITFNGNGFTWNSSATNSTGHLLQFWGTYNASSPSVASETGILVKNCEFYGILTTTHIGNNGAGLWFEGCYQCIAQNNYFHDIGSTSSTDHDHVHAGEEYGCWGNQWILNTISNCSSGIEAKNVCTGTVCAYNYFFNVGVGRFGQSAVFEAFDGATGNPTSGPSPVPYLLHHNVIDGCGVVHIADENTNFIANSLYCYNNTVYDNSSGSTLGWQLYATSALLEFYNNIYFSTASTGGGGGKNGKIVVGAGGWLTLDYNSYYQASSNYSTMWGLNTTGYSSLASWQGATSAESHSITGNPTFASSITSGAGPTQFQLGSGSPCIGTGQGGGNMGAWDGSSSQVGCAWMASQYPLTANSNGN